jgi:hypothetical protein
MSDYPLVREQKGQCAQVEGKSSVHVEWATVSDGWADLRSNYSLAGNYEGVYEGIGPSREDEGQDPQEYEIEEDSEDTIEIEDTEETEPAIPENQEQESEEKESEEISEEQERQNED